jgi:hypothetical protein
MSAKHGVAPGQVYDTLHNGQKTGRVVIDSFAEYGARGEEMWTTVGGGGSKTNVLAFIELGWWCLYSQNPLNGR